MNSCNSFFVGVRRGGSTVWVDFDELPIGVGRGENLTGGWKDNGTSSSESERCLDANWDTLCLKRALPSSFSPFPEKNGKTKCKFVEKMKT